MKALILSYKFEDFGLLFSQISGHAVQFFRAFCLKAAALLV